MPDIPKTVQWLLDFANLGCRPGVFNPRKMFSDVDIKRPPVKQPPPRTKPTVVSSEEEFLETDERCAWIEHEGHVWKKVKNKMYYEGKRNAFPIEGAIIEGDKIQRIWSTGDPLVTLEDFQKLFPETKFDPDEGFLLPFSFWGKVRFAVFCKTNFGKKTHKPLEFYESSVHHLLGLRYPNPCLEKIQDSIRILWYEHKNLHPLLNLCQCCGIFWMQKKTKGKPQVFCSIECKEMFHRQAREVVKKRVRKIRAVNREFQQKEDVKELEKWLINKEEFLPREAKKRAYELVYKYKETFKNYKRTVSIKYGIL